MGMMTTAGVARCVIAMIMVAVAVIVTPVA
jgi:hypothetical protein